MPDYMDPFKDSNEALSDLSDAYLREKSFVRAPRRDYDFSTSEYYIDGYALYFVLLQTNPMINDKVC